MTTSEPLPIIGVPTIEPTLPRHITIAYSNLTMTRKFEIAEELGIAHNLSHSPRNAKRIRTEILFRVRNANKSAEFTELVMKGEDI